MQVERAADPLTSLRLVHPPEAPAAAGTPEVVTCVRDVPRLPDSYNFDAIYSSSLRRVPWTQAHQRLERLRSSLVAARTQVPIYFTDPTYRRAMNPYGPSYMRIAPTPTEVNAAAVEQLSTP